MQIVGEDIFHHPHENIAYKGNLACFIPVQVFPAGGQEPRKAAQHTRILVEHLHI